MDFYFNIALNLCRKSSPGLDFRLSRRFRCIHVKTGAREKLINTLIGETGECERVVCPQDDR